MNSRPTEHPSFSQLRSFVLGTMNLDDISAIEDHVLECATCQLALEEVTVSDDPFIQKLERVQALDRWTHEGSAERQSDAAFPQPFDATGRFREYQFHSKIGRGGMGVVYKALHTRLDRRVAFKMLTPEMTQSSDMVARFEREIKLVAKLEHSNIVRAHDAGEHAGCHFLVMEFVDGVTLDVLVKRLGRLPVREACEIIRQAALGLDHAHRNGLVHRDVKPSNLIVAEGSTVKLLDLGLARLLSESSELTEINQVVGTIDYIAPEQTQRDGNIDHRADIYSLGCTLYTILAGQAPFGGKSHVSVAQKVLAHIQEPLPRLSHFRSDVPARVIEILDLMTAKSPSHRFQSAAAVAEALALFVAGADLRGLVHEQQVAPTLPFPAQEQIAKPAGESPCVASVPHKFRRTVVAVAGGLTLIALLLIVALVKPRWLGLPVRDSDVGQLAVVDVSQNRTPSSIKGQGVQNALQDSSSKSHHGQSIDPEVLVPVAQASKVQPKLSPTELLASDVYEWTPLEYLGSPINTAGYEAGACISGDGMSLLFHANQRRPDKGGNLLIWEAWRHELSEPFQRPILLEAAFNVPPNDVSDPTLTHDRRTLSFCQKASTGFGGFDLWIADRPGADVSWNLPTNAGSAVNSNHNEWEPELSADGLLLIFHSDRPNPHGGTDLWIARRVARDLPFEAAENLGPGINSADDEGGAALSSDGLTLIFHRYSRTGPVALTHWQATSKAANHAFEHPQSLLIPGLAEKGAVSLSLSSAGDRIYCTTIDLDTRPDIAVSKRIRKAISR